jgi:hypothetical protein
MSEHKIAALPIPPELLPVVTLAERSSDLVLLLLALIKEKRVFLPNEVADQLQRYATELAHRQEVIANAFPRLADEQALTSAADEVFSKVSEGSFIVSAGGNA